MPELSIILPVYKMEKFLPRVIASIKAQTMRDFEAIFVDDGSPDNSGAICLASAADDSRFRVITRENGGVSKARNTALDAATGEYVMFVDPDDWIEPDAAEVLVGMAKNHNADIVLYGRHNDRYSSDGKTLTDCTAEFLNADKVYRHRTPMLAITGKKVSLIDTAKYLDKNTTEWNWYRDMGWREYIAYGIDLTAIGNETPIRLFNTNILMTNCAFYEIVYASEPLDDNDKNAQTAPDGSVSPYYPTTQHLNCSLTLRKITLLTNYYKDVRNICTSHVITDDYTLLPISEIMTEGYAEYYKYDCNKFYNAYRDE